MENSLLYDAFVKKKKQEIRVLLQKVMQKFHIVNKSVYFYNLFVEDYLSKHAKDASRMKTMQQLQANVMRDLDHWESLSTTVKDMNTLFSLFLNLDMIKRIVGVK